MHKKGFTLIELLVVIGIIGILASVVLLSVNATRSKARDAERKADLHEIAKAIDMYYLDRGYLPRNLNGWCTYISNTTSGWGAAFQADLAPEYIPRVSLDPLMANKIGDYLYKNQDNGNGDFFLCANLETPTGQSYNYSACAGGAVYNYCVNR